MRSRDARERVQYQPPFFNPKVPIKLRIGIQRLCRILPIEEQDVNKNPGEDSGSGDAVAGHGGLVDVLDSEDSGGLGVPVDVPGSGDVAGPGVPEDVPGLSDAAGPGVPVNVPGSGDVIADPGVSVDVPGLGVPTYVAKSGDVAGHRVPGEVPDVPSGESGHGVLQDDLPDVPRVEEDFHGYAQEDVKRAREKREKLINICDNL